MPFLKQTTTQVADDGVELEKARAVVVYEGDTGKLSETLSQLAADHKKRTTTETNPTGEKYSALVLVLPLYEGMPSEEIFRERKLKEKGADGKMVETGEVEKYLSARKYADSATFALRNFFITDENHIVKAGIRFFEAPKKSVVAGEADEDGEDESGDTGENGAE